MQLHQLKKSPGYNKPGKRLGRGNSSRSGNYCGKGIKGQKARSGGSVAPWFEGGQTPLYRRLPKLRGFKRFHKLMADVSPVNVSDLTKVEGTIVSKESLLTAGLISKVSLPVKILGTGDVATAYTCEGIEAFSASAKKKIEAAGGSCGVE